MRLVVAVLVFCVLGRAYGCGAPSTSARARPPAIEVPSPDVDAEDPDEATVPGPEAPELMLGDDHARRHRRRAQLAIYERARILLEGPSLVRDEPRVPYEDETPHVVVAVNGAWARIVSEAHHMRVLVWVGRDQLRTVVVQRARLSASAVAPGNAEDAIVLYPGVSLRSHEQRTGRVRVTYEDGALAFGGWLPETALGHVYTPDDDLVEWTADATVRAGTNVVSRTGATLATFREDTDVQRAGTAGTKQRIAYRKRVPSKEAGARGAIEIRGLVAPSAVMSRVAGIGTVASGGGEGWGGSHVIRVPKGTPLFASPDGALVAITTGEALARQGESKGGYDALEMKTLWGFTTFYARESGAAR